VIPGNRPSGRLGGPPISELARLHVRSASTMMNNHVMDGQPGMEKMSARRFPGAT
jgi:hypothetical protein